MAARRWGGDGYLPVALGLFLLVLRGQLAHLLLHLGLGRQQVINTLDSLEILQTQLLDGLLHPLEHLLRIPQRTLV